MLISNHFQANLPFGAIWYSAAITRNTADNFPKMGKTMMMMMIKCFCGMVYRRKALSIISRRHHCQSFSPSLIADTPQVGVEPAQKLHSGFVERSCAIVTTITPRRHYFRCLNQVFLE